MILKFVSLRTRQDKMDYNVIKPQWALRTVLMSLAALAFLIPAIFSPLDDDPHWLAQLSGRFISATPGLLILYVEWWTWRHRLKHRPNGETSEANEPS